MSEIQEIQKLLVDFRDEREWKQFHNSKDLALAISIEAGELLEIFLWKDNEDFNTENLKEELADIMSYCFLLAEKNGLDVKKIIKEKVAENAKKYPVSKSKGNANKYTEL